MDQETTAEPDNWPYPVCELMALPAVYYLVAIISLILVFVGNEVRWYQFILPLSIGIFYRGSSYEYKEKLVAATVYRYATPEAAKRAFPNSDPDVIAQRIARIASKKTWKITQIEEQYLKPQTPVIWVLFLLLTAIVLLRLLTVLLWSFSARLSLFQVLGLLLGLYVISIVFKAIRLKLLFNLAMNRWVSTFFSGLRANPDLEKELMETHSLRQTDISEWLSNEVTKLTQAGVDPDYIKLEALVNPRSGATSQEL